MYHKVCYDCINPFNEHKTARKATKFVSAPINRKLPELQIGLPLCVKCYQSALQRTPQEILTTDSNSPGISSQDLKWSQEMKQSNIKTLNTLLVDNLKSPIKTVSKYSLKNVRKKSMRSPV
jgi:hypothetical protein